MGTDDSDLKLVDIISSNDFRADSHIIQEENRQVIEELLKTLPPRDAEIIRMYFGIGKSHRYTLDEIGAYFNLTRERVRQIKNKAMLQLRKNAKQFFMEQ